MTQLAYAVRNYLVQQSDVTSLLGSDAEWGPWIFVDVPRVPIEGTGQCLIVISQDAAWAQANEHNTARFPRVMVDMWADPTRNPDKSMRKPDAKLKIEELFARVNKYLHLVDNSVPGGGSVFWGTADEISQKTGVRIVSSTRSRDIDYSPTFDNTGGFMGRSIYHVTI